MFKGSNKTTNNCNKNRICQEILHYLALFGGAGIKKQQALKIVHNCLNTNIYFYLGTSGGQSSNQYLNVGHFFNTSVN
jgi:hypothetical protein